MTWKLLKQVFFIHNSYMCWKLEHSFWIVSEKNGHICWRNVVFWLAHVQIKSAGACKTPASMYGLLCIHKTSDLRLSFRMFDMLQTFLLKSFRKKKKKTSYFCSLPTKFLEPLSKVFHHALKTCQFCLFCPSENEGLETKMILVWSDWKVACSHLTSCSQSVESETHL